MESGRTTNRFSRMADYYPLSQFQQLSQHVSSKSVNRLNTNHPISTREEIYLSLLKQIRSKSPNMNSLVKKASGILRLSNLQSDDVNVYSSNKSKISEVQKSNSKIQTFNQTAQIKKSQEELKSLGIKASELVTQLARNGGDFSEIWDYIEGPSSETSTSRAPSRQSNLSKSSVTSRNKSNSNTQRTIKKPPWRYFGNQKIISNNSSTSIISSVRSSGSSDYTERTSSIITNSKSKWNKTGTPERKEEVKADYVKHVFVIKGQVVTFKGEGFESFTNWFGDIRLLRNNVNTTGTHHRHFRRELDVSGFSNQEIRMKLYEGYKLVIEAFRPNRDGLPPMRFKSTIVLPKEMQVERLIMCRSALGRLIIQDSPKPWSGTVN